MPLGWKKSPPPFVEVTGVLLALRCVERKRKGWFSHVSAAVSRRAEVKKVELYVRFYHFD